ncbi:MAG: sodium-dependent transporter [Lentisphaeria bacterium]|nr:sodium-dependent transporter [Lentisphaeria bacterium]
MSVENNHSEHWGSRFGFIMAAAGSAIGLGNIWKFPYIVGLNGGGAFVLIYILCILLVGLPCMIGEFAVGRASRSDAIGALKKLAPRNSFMPKLFGGYGLGLGTMLLMNDSLELGCLVLVLSALMLIWGWGFIGFANVFVAGVILSYYAIIGGWLIYYTYLAFTNALAFKETAEASAAFVQLASNGHLSAIFGGAFIIACCVVCWFGVKKGIEGVSKLVMPLMLGIILVLVIRSLTLPGAIKGLDFYLTPRFSNITAKGVLEALGHAFYSLSLGMAILIVYGSYLPKNRDIVKSACYVAVLDTCIALFAGFAIFPAVFAMGMNPAAGPGLIFNILPVTFNAIPGNLGWLWSGLFFILMFIAAFTSGISLLETVSASFISRLRMKRRAAVLLSSVLIGSLMVVISYSIVSYNAFPKLHDIIKEIFGSAKGSFFDDVDFYCSSWILPMNGLALAIFSGWTWGVKHISREIYRGTKLEHVELDLNKHRMILQFPMASWAFFIRFIAPVMIFMILCYGAGLFKKILN